MGSRQLTDLNILKFFATFESLHKRYQVFLENSDRFDFEVL